MLESAKELFGKKGWHRCENVWNYLIDHGKYNFNYYNINYLCKYNGCYNTKPMHDFLNREDV